VTRTGAVIMAFFATVWWVVGLRIAGQPLALIIGVPLLVIVVLGVAARGGGQSAMSRAEHDRRGRLVGVASAVEGIAIFVVANVLGNTGKASYDAPAIAIIVGLHFLPLAWGLPAGAYYATAAALVAIGGIGIALPDATQRLLVVSVGAAGILWLTSLGAMTNRQAGSLAEGR
jgi:hypothetical protein